MIEDPQLQQLFKAESTEHLARLDDGLLRLEKNCADQALLEEVFREAHSLKGAARMLGLSKIESSAHGLEGILNSARKGDSPLTPDAIDQMTVVLGELRNLVQEALAVPSVEARTPELLNEMQPAEPTPSAAGTLAASQSSKEDGTGAETALAAPSADVTLSRSVPTNNEPFHIETVRVETRKLDDLLTLTSELRVIQGRVQHRLLLIDEMLEQWSMLDRGRRKLRFQQRGTENTTGTDDTLSRMLHADGTAVTLLGSRIKQTRDSFYEDGTRLEAAANTLEEKVHAIRLLPLSTVFALFPRMIRDLAREQGKDVELVIEGGELNVDKRVLEEMKDPLMHLLRNAVDHGIESPVERKRLGKPRRGTLQLRAARENNTVLLEVRDDGHGLDVDAIRQAAMQRGLHDEATLSAMTMAQLQQLLFLPGFTTSTFITELSGRGVGLDVVRVNVERLKGDIRVESAPHQGTLMQLRLPLSLSTTRLLLVSVNDHCYGLPIEFVNTSRYVREEDIFTLEGRPTFELYGQAVIAPRLADLLELPPAKQHDETACIVIQVGDELLGLRVDELLDEEEVLAKPLGAPLQRVRNVSGISILGSGEICAVLNPADLLRSAHKLAATSGESKHGQSGPQVKSCILLVEDTMLVRVMEKRILEASGYEVVAAVDGMDALNVLGSRTFAAVVSDIMMPNMDGLTLTARIRREPRYRDLPIILVTSLSSDEDKRRGMEAGANAYIPKPSFDQRLLLDTLQRLVVP